MKRSYPIERFDPLLRDLVTWDLVNRGTRPHSWKLTDAAQRRLEELVGWSAPVATEQMVYLDHRCADCQQHVRTRIHDGLYLCDGCAERRATPSAAVIPAAGKRRWRRNRPAVDGTNPVAS